MSNPTREDIVAEMGEVEKDLRVFAACRDLIRSRISEMDPLPERRKIFVDWPATQVILNGLIIAIVRCEGLVGEYQNILEQMDVPNNVVSLVRETNE